MTASTRGAAHEATDRPNQDAQGWRVLDPARRLVIGAVADGHGHSRHFRSEQGARLAVEQGCDAAAAVVGTFDGLEADNQVAGAVRAELVDRVVDRWSRAVAEDHDRRPFNPEEEAVRAMYDDEVAIAYGSTLLLLVLLPRWVVVAQIGDGDVVALHADGSVAVPVTVDPSLDGHYTTSLCQPGAADSFRVAVLDRSETPVLGMLAATDGFGNAQAAEPWQD
ncbi:MAG: protein phosphatase 2C domain-containing protein, partial [Thermoplasmata archaeon]